MSAARSRGCFGVFSRAEGPEFGSFRLACLTRVHGVGSYMKKQTTTKIGPYTVSYDSPKKVYKT